MQTVQGDLVVVGAHTTQPVVLWKGVQVQDITTIRVLNGVVTLTLAENPVLADMKLAGVQVVRV